MIRPGHGWRVATTITLLHAVKIVTLGTFNKHILLHDLFLLSLVDRL